MWLYNIEKTYNFNIDYNFKNYFILHLKYFQHYDFNE